MFYWLTTHLEIVAIVTITLIAAVVILQQRRTPQSAAAWLLFIVAVPWFAIPLFLGLGFRKHRSRYTPVSFLAAENGAPAAGHPVATTFQRFGLPAAVDGQSLHLLIDPQVSWRALSELIDSAEIEIDAMFYIVAGDPVGEAFVNALTRRAENGVRVRLLMDRLGTGFGPSAALRRLRAAGGDVRFYSPMLQAPLRTHFNLRNHRKMVVVDDARAFGGGMNIGAHYLSPDPTPQSWADLAYILEGTAVRRLGDVFNSDWEVVTGIEPAPEAAIAPATGGHATVQLIPSGPDVAEDALHDGLVRALHLSESRIWIVTPYFIPTEELGTALASAARRGVDVRVLVPKHSNQRTADFARGAYLRDLSEVGATILYYENGMLHAKAGIIDNMGFVGSANFDVRSMLLNFETTLFVYDSGTVGDMSDWFQRLAAQASVDAPHASMLRRAAEAVFRLGAPVL